MSQEPPDHQIVFRAVRRDTCMELRLVLESAGIANQVSHQSGEWFLSVAEHQEGAALSELAAYRADNPITQAVAAPRVPVFGGAIFGSFLYGAMIVLIGAVSLADESQANWFAAGQMNSGQVMSGEVWRSFTALTLHADAEHLLSNLAFGCVFGLMAGRILGGGIAWLTIVLAGAVGNGLNAAMRESTHTSIGASTAVFAALGVMVAHALHPRFVTSDKVFQRWSPLIGGVLLLAFVGIGGERTDVGAHVTGLVAGVLLGWIAARLPLPWLSNDRVQLAAGGIAIGLVTIAWAIAAIRV